VRVDFIRSSPEVVNLAQSLVATSESPEIDFSPRASSDVLESVSLSLKEDFNFPSADDDCGTILTSQLPPNLETRRRRRDSSLLKDIGCNNAIEVKQHTMEQVHLTKSGFKRKLGVRDADESTSQWLGEHDDFQYTRVSEVSRSSLKDPGVGEQDLVGQCVSNKSRQQSRKERKGTRRVLELSMSFMLCSFPLIKLTSLLQRVPMSMQVLQKSKSIPES
jgi:hypothetical protein